MSNNVSPGYPNVMPPMPHENPFFFPTPSSAWMESFANTIFTKSGDPEAYVKPRIAFRREWSACLPEGQSIGLNEVALEQTLTAVGAPANNARLLIEMYLHSSPYGTR